MAKLKHLEGLRGVAALIVLFCHLRNLCFWPQQNAIVNKINSLAVTPVVKISITSIIAKLVDGSLPVWIFWVLSAYVISIALFRQGESYNRVLMASFSKRYVRLLLPVLASILFAYIILRAGGMFNLRLANEANYSKDWLGTFYRFQPNIYLALKSAFFDTFFDFNLDTTYNSSLWTIQNEFLGSLFIFAIFGVLRHFSKRYIVYALALLILYKLHLQWLCAFVAGFALCDYDYSESSSPQIQALKQIEKKIHAYTRTVLLLSILFIVFGESLMNRFDIIAPSRYLVLSVSIVYFCLRNNTYERMFSAKAPLWLGKVSFGMYLIHLPIICSLTSYLVLQNPSLAGKAIACMITIVAVLAGAFLFTKYIDTASIKYSKQLGDYFTR